MSLAKLFLDHLKLRLSYLEKALTVNKFDALIISSGSPVKYFADSIGTSLNAVPHFGHYCPLTGPNHAIKLQPNKKPFLIHYAPQSFWYESLDLDDAFWIDGFNIVKVCDLKTLWDMLTVSKTSRTAYIGDDIESAMTANLEPNPIELTAYLDWGRKYKTPYEIKCIEEATAKSAKGHIAGQLAFLAGASELDIHYTFMKATQSLESELAFATIVAINEKSAILHYASKRTLGNGQTLLMDCGVKVRGYASDITRTITNTNCDPIFKNMIVSMRKNQQELIANSGPNKSFKALNNLSHLKLAELLKEHNILYSEPELAIELGLTKLFCPHNLGHHLGIQVHDVTGKLTNKNNNAAATTQQSTLPIDEILEPGNVITIEPGCYFIPTLLEPFRTNKYSKQLNWKLIDQLSCLGGIRIEDNILITETGHNDITKKYLPN